MMYKVGNYTLDNTKPVMACMIPTSIIVKDIVFNIEIEVSDRFNMIISMLETKTL